MTEKILDRIKKMLALANDLGATEGERDTALRHAYATMAKHNIEMAHLDSHTAAKQEQRIDFSNVSFSWAWARSINGIIGEMFFCECFSWERINGTQVTFHFIGKESNAMTAAVMADWVVKSILKEARKMYKQNTSPQTRSFATGAMMALSARVAEIKRSQQAASESSEPGTALVLASLYDTEKAANALMLPKDLREAKSRNTKVSGDAYARGHAFGNSINLSNQITEEARKLK